MTDALLSAIGFAAHFPALATPRAPDIWDRLAEDDAKRAAHVAEVAPILERIYRVTPAHVDEAFNDVSCWLLKRHHALMAALVSRDEAEIGRLLLVLMDARIRDVATDYAQEDSYVAVPERAL